MRTNYYAPKWWVAAISVILGEADYFPLLPFCYAVMIRTSFRWDYCDMKFAVTFFLIMTGHFSFKIDWLIDDSFLIHSSMIHKSYRKCHACMKINNIFPIATNNTRRSLDSKVSLKVQIKCCLLHRNEHKTCLTVEIDL